MLNHSHINTVLMCRSLGCSSRKSKHGVQEIRNQLKMNLMGHFKGANLSLKQKEEDICLSLLLREEAYQLIEGLSSVTAACDRKALLSKRHCHWANLSAPRPTCQ
jgi:hypothetical protein